MFKMLLAGFTGWMLATRPELRERVLDIFRQGYAALTRR